MPIPVMFAIDDTGSVDPTNSTNPAEKPRILVACELGSYREAIAGAFRELRPGAEVYEAEVKDLDREVERLHPDLVVCSRVSEVVDGGSPVWIEMYPDHEARSVVSVKGERSMIEHIQLADLLTVFDRAQQLAPPE